MSEIQAQFSVLKQTADPAVADAIARLIDKGEDHELNRINVLDFSRRGGFDDPPRRRTVGAMTCDALRHLLVGGVNGGRRREDHALSARPSERSGASALARTDRPEHERRQALAIRRQLHHVEPAIGGGDRLCLLAAVVGEILPAEPGAAR